MKETKNKKQLILSNPLRFIWFKARLNRAVCLAPLIAIISILLVFSFLKFYPHADLILKSILLSVPVVTNSLYGFTALAVVMILAIAAYYYIDYQQHYRPLAQEMEDVAYSPIHHAKVVALPLLKYRWKSLTYWLSFGVTTIAVLSLAITFQVSPVFAYEANEFVTTWDTTKLVRGTVTNTAISIGADTANYSYNYTVDWGDGNVQPGITSSVEHDYGTAGIYTVKITGTFPTLYRLGSSEYDRSDHASQILTVEQWGTNQWATMADAFRGNKNIVFNAVDAPNLSNVTSMDFMFTGAINFNSPIDNWDVSNVTSMNSMFWSANNFNQPLNSWNTSSLQNIDSMFLEAYKFNQDLDNWDVSRITSMAGVFSAAAEFNGDILTWDTSNVENFGSMFDNAQDFNQDISSWDTSKATSMAGMFKYATTFNQPIGAWNTSNVISMDSMFEGASVFNRPIGAWNTSKVATMEEMFYWATAFDRPIDNWDVSAVTTFKSMFMSADSFNQPLNSWDLTSATNITYMFYKAKNFNSNISDWDVSGITSMASLFREAEKFNQNIDAWDVSSVTDMGYMFNGAKLFNQPLDSWIPSGLTYAPYMFASAYLFNQNINDWNVGNLTTMDGMFYSAKAFNQPLGSWNVSNVTNMNSTFSNADAFNQPLSNWDVSKVKNMSSMFYAADSFNQDLDGWITSSLTDTTYMFWNTKVFNGNVSSWNMAGVTSLVSMFRGAEAFNQPVNNWDVSNVTTTENMFYDAKAFNQSFTGWQTSKLVNMSQMVRGATDFNQSLAGLNISKVKTINAIFYDTNMSPYNYDLTLIDWNSQSLQQSVYAQSSTTYCQGASAKLNMIATYNWTIYDGGLSCPVPDVDTGAAIDVTSTSAELSGTTNNGFSYPVTETGFEYGEDTNYGQETVVSSGLGAFDTVQSSLACETTYHFRAYAKSANGTGYGDDETFITDECPVPQTDYSLTMDRLSNDIVNSGDDVNLKLRIKNEGPNNGGIYGLIYLIISPDFNAQSVVSPATLTQQGPFPISSAPGAPQEILDKYPNYSAMILSNVSTPFYDIVGDSFDVYVSGVATGNFIDNTYIARAVYVNGGYEADFAQDFSNAIGGGQDFFDLPGNNTASYVYHAPIIADPDPSPINPTNPDGGPNIPTTTPPNGGGGGGGTNPTTKAPTIPKGLKPAKKIETETPPSFEDLTNPEKLKEKMRDRAKQNEKKVKVDTSPQASVLAAYTIKTARSLPWVLLLLITAAYIIQAARLARQNRAAKKALAIIVRTHDLLEGFVEIISHYLGTAVTIIGLSISLLQKKPGENNPHTIQTLNQEAGRVRAGINSIIAQLQQQVRDIEQDIQRSAKPQKKSVIIWVVIPIVVMALTLILVYVSFNYFDIDTASQANTLFVVSMFFASSLLLTISFYVWKNQIAVASGLANTTAHSQRATELRLAFINDNSSVISGYASSIIQKANDIDDDAFSKRFNAGAESLQTTSQAFAKVYELTSVKITAKAVLGKDSIMKSLTPLQQQATEAGIDLQLQIPDNITFKLLPNELSHLITSTVENAIKFTPKGGTIVVTTTNQGKQSILTVKDTGTGIPTDKQATLMQPFTRATSNTEYNYEGLGLNLYISRLIAEKYGGSIELESKSEQGTTVRIAIRNG